MPIYNQSPYEEMENVASQSLHRAYDVASRATIVDAEVVHEATISYMRIVQAVTRKLVQQIESCETPEDLAALIRTLKEA